MALFVPTTSVQQAEAHGHLVAWLRKRQRGVVAKAGYEVHIESVILETFPNGHPNNIQDLIFANNAAFADAAWDLCRRGILRPSVLVHGPGLEDGYGYSITPLGAAWLAEVKDDPFVATEPTQLATMLASHRKRFGEGFHERAQEAVKDYRSNAFLSCCAMCGAAAESVLLTAAIAKKKDELAILKEYRTSRGRGRIQNLVLGSATDPIRNAAAPGLSLLKYWRDDAAHGGLSGVTEATAFTSILLLVRLASLVDDHWGMLTS